MTWVGLISDDLVQHRIVAQAIAEAGFTLSSSVTQDLAEIKRICRDHHMTVKACSSQPVWIVDTRHDLDHEVELFLLELDAIVIYLDRPLPPAGVANFEREYAQLLQKLAYSVAQGQQSLKDTTVADEVWLLAASTGGPEAVAEFLQALPPELGIGFLYVQHINTGFNDTLLKMVSRVSALEAIMAASGEVVRKNQLVLVSCDHYTKLLENRALLVQRKPWPGAYSPSVDAMIAEFTNAYGAHGGVIVFTGMGNDGEVALRLFGQRGGKVWAQTPETCVVSSMPDSAIGTGLVEFVGKPVELAKKLTAIYQGKYPQEAVV
ncbi:chemotaxis protein CheB [Marinibactrum halimedae]|uniref:protein-glutamate methylesterase n=1 Tax=Marinibactrum halimedae TaxID=1444977 RepID=A0AA37TAW3_9GAMM|nr:chemotaxis protein CheB [Marinibactrum halimedae]MCD9458331.1 chemotaxis protein CheB [Marinibactrum halimedae]GLS27041.1 protein-glutamate methylesterase [Marinibactrum halimedae]